MFTRQHSERVIRMHFRFYVVPLYFIIQRNINVLVKLSLLVSKLIQTYNSVIYIHQVALITNHRFKLVLPFYILNIVVDLDEVGC